MIKRLGKKRYLVRVYAGRDAAGKRLSTAKVIYGERELAEKYELDLLQKKNRGQPLSESRQTLSVYFAEWHKAVSERMKEKTHLWYKGQFENHIKPAFGHVRLSALRPVEIEQFYAEKLRSGLSGRSVESLHSVLSIMYADAVRWQLVRDNPMKYVRLPKRKKVEMLCLSPAEAQEFIKASYSEEYGLIFRFALKTGMRPEEYLGLKWSDIDFNYRDAAGKPRGKATVRQTVIPGKPGGGWWDSVPKSDAGYRDALFPSSLLQELKEHRARQLERKMGLGSHYQDHDLVFATSVGTPVDARMLSYRVFKRVLKSAGLNERVRLYDLRHSWVTLSIMAGADPKTVSKQAGHASVAFTLQVYGHVLPEMKEAAADKLEALLASG